MSSRRVVLFAESEMLRLWILALIALSFALFNVVLAQQPIVNTPSGSVAGVALSGVNSVSQFLGIPYAAPPVGSLRWAAPVPAGPWTGTLSATNAPNACPQNVTHQNETGLNGAPGMSEDCLYLNVWTPCLGSQCRLPVLVYLHGGSLQIGYSADPRHVGMGLAALGAVVVTLNYRLGAFGCVSYSILSRRTLRVAAAFDSSLQLLERQAP
jgi:para-nitrobenzyl esterase